MRQSYFFAWFWIVVALVGCGGPPTGPKLATVEGAVTLDGKPLSGVIVSFQPTGSTHGAGAEGYTDKAGKYELTDRYGAKGALAGEYRVVLMRFAMPDGSDFPRNSDVPPIESSAQQVLPAKYSDADRTVLKATVHDGANTIDFPLSSKP